MCAVCLDKQTEEKVVDESSSSHCFTHLQQETLYRISVHSRLGSAEGAAVSILHPTGLNPRFSELSVHRELSQELDTCASESLFAFPPAGGASGRHKLDHQLRAHVRRATKGSKSTIKLNESRERGLNWDSAAPTTHQRTMLVTWQIWPIS